MTRHDRPEGRPSEVGTSRQSTSAPGQPVRGTYARLIADPGLLLGSVQTPACPNRASQVVVRYPDSTYVVNDHAVRTGDVVFHNPVVRGEVAPFHVAIAIQLEDSSARTRAVVSAISFVSRQPDNPVTADAIRQAPIGAWVRRAVEHLTRGGDGPVSVARVARSALANPPATKPDRRATDRLERLREFARWHDEAIEYGEPYARYVARHMDAVTADRITESRARQMKREAIAAGIELRKG